MVREFLLLVREELCFSSVLGEVEEREYGEEKCAGAFDDEEVAPGVEWGVGDAEDAHGEQAREGVRDVGGCVEDCETSGQLAAAVEGGEIVDYQGEESAFGHT